MKDRTLSPQQFEELLPLAIAWAEQQEALILAAGTALTETQQADAREVGVAQPGRVRLLAVAAMPMPEPPLLRAAAEATGLINAFTVGLTMGYGIYVRRDFTGDRLLLAHELVHTAQYERLGGIAPYLRQYLHECITIGYPDAPMEQEAILTSQRFRHSGR